VVLASRRWVPGSVGRTLEQSPAERPPTPNYDGILLYSHTTTSALNRKKAEKAQPLHIRTVTMNHFAEAEVERVTTSDAMSEWRFICQQELSAIASVGSAPRAGAVSGSSGAQRLFDVSSDADVLQSIGAAVEELFDATGGGDGEAYSLSVSDSMALGIGRTNLTYGEILAPGLATVLRVALGGSGGGGEEEGGGGGGGGGNTVGRRKDGPLETMGTGSEHGEDGMRGGDKNHSGCMRAPATPGLCSGDATFVDVGCGRGFAVLAAARLSDAGLLGQVGVHGYEGGSSPSCACSNTCCVSGTMAVDAARAGDDAAAAALAAAAACPHRRLRRCIGVEILPSLVACAHRALDHSKVGYDRAEMMPEAAGAAQPEPNLAAPATEPEPARAASGGVSCAVEFVCADFLSEQAEVGREGYAAAGGASRENAVTRACCPGREHGGAPWWASATVVYAAATRFEDALRGALLQRLRLLQAGARVIVVTWDLNEVDSGARSGDSACGGGGGGGCRFVERWCGLVGYSWGEEVTRVYEVVKETGAAAAHVDFEKL